MACRDQHSSAGNDLTAAVIAGEAFGVKSPVYTRTPTYYLDFKMEPGSTLRQKIPEGWTAFIYVLSGSALVGPDGAGEAVKGKDHFMMVLSTKEGEDGILVKSEVRRPPCSST